MISSQNLWYVGPISLHSGIYSAQAKVKEVADDINEARREAESLTRLYELASKIDDIDFVRLPSPLCS